MPIRGEGHSQHSQYEQTRFFAGLLESCERHPLVTASAAGAAAARVQKDEDNDNGDGCEDPGHHEPACPAPGPESGSRVFVMVCGHKTTPSGLPLFNRYSNPRDRETYA